MFSWFLRFIYSFTYYIHLAIIGELYQISKYGIMPTFTQEQAFLNRVTEVLQIHYPVLIIILCLIIANCMVKGTKKLSAFTVQMKTTEPFGIESLYTGVQIIPYLTFVFKEQLFGLSGALVLVIITVLFIVRHGSYNLSLLLLGYRQYKVKTENSTIWLVSKLKMSRFPNTESVHTLQDNVFVRYE